MPSTSSPRRAGSSGGMLASVVIGFLACCGASGAAASQSLGCNGALASEGDSKASVIAKCGQPMSVESLCLDRPQSVWAQPYPGAALQPLIVQQCEPMEDWTYFRGQGRFLGIVRFRNGVIDSIRDGARIP